MLNLSDIDRN